MISIVSLIQKYKNITAPVSDDQKNMHKNNDLKIMIPFTKENDSLVGYRVGKHCELVIFPSYTW